MVYRLEPPSTGDCGRARPALDVSSGDTPAIDQLRSLMNDPLMTGLLHDLGWIRKWLVSSSGSEYTAITNIHNQYSSNQDRKGVFKKRYLILLLLRVQRLLQLHSHAKLTMEAPCHDTLR